MVCCRKSLEERSVKQMPNIMEFIEKETSLRVRLANRYTTVTKYDCDLTSEWWEKFKALTPEKLFKAKSILH